MQIVKICGITRLEDALAAVEAGANALGFNFWRPGKRYIAPERAAEIARALPGGVRRVGVFVDESAESVRSIAELVGLDTLQLHGLPLNGKESPEYVAAFTQFRTWKSFCVKPGWTPDAFAGYTSVEAFLLDAAGATPGGTGQTFDWSIAADASVRANVVLAGGLTPANIAQAVRAVKPWGVDVASGVEDSPGIKNHSMVREFVRAARKAEESE